MSDEKKHILHFSLGPVQSFIGSARRTRDLWAGSFLLAWLTAHAMATVRRKGGCIRFPNVDNDALVKAVEAKSSGQTILDRPEHATVPNRFKAEVPTSPTRFDPKDCETAVSTAWKRLADAVWTAFPGKFEEVHKVPLPIRTEAIWREQVKNFWEVSWVMGPEEGDDGRWLDQRKTWRSHRRPDEEEGGDHCTLMGEWQEISGYVRAKEASRQLPDGTKDNRQEKFWNGFRNLTFTNKKGDKPKRLLLDIVEGERLCAIALIKRLFPRLSEDDRKHVFGWDPVGENGGNWPSTGHVAAAHWITKAWKVEQGLCSKYAKYIDDSFADLHFAEQNSQIACVKAIAPTGHNQKHWFGALDANFYDRNDLLNSKAMPIIRKTNEYQESTDPALLSNEEREEFIKRQYDPLIKAIRDADPELGSPAGYFALLRMDGDRTGELLGEDRDREKAVAAALKEFADQAKTIVPSLKHNGVLVYAGGDDLLALFPIEDALSAAFKLREEYLEAFRPYLQALKLKEPPTISAGLVFADHHEPFRAVVEESRRLLEDVAKEKNGRDSIACSVMKPSGRAVEWVSRWTDDGKSLTERVAQIAGRMRDEKPFSNRFIYNLRSRYLEPLERVKGGQAVGQFKELNLSADEIIAILTAERSGSRDLQKKSGESEEEKKLVERIRLISVPHPGPEADSSKPREPLNTDGLMLARFLAQKGL